MEFCFKQILLLYKHFILNFYKHLSLFLTAKAFFSPEFYPRLKPGAKKLY